MSRKSFIESVGATCSNWRSSWSFVNHDERFVIFGAWDILTEGSASIIFDDEWERGSTGWKQPAFRESGDHIRLIEDEGYRLLTFPMAHSSDLQDVGGVGQPRSADLHLNCLNAPSLGWAASVMPEMDR